MRWEWLLLLSALLPSACSAPGPDKTSIRRLGSAVLQSGSDEALVRERAVRGDAQAQYELGSRYFYGQGLQPDDAQAAQWFRRAADQGRADAQNFLAMMYRDGRGLTLDLGQAALWARKSAEQGHARGQGLLGIMTFDGHGVPRDAVEGYKWETLALARTTEDDMKKFASNAVASMAKTMSEEEVARGEARAREWTVARQTLEDTVREVALLQFCRDFGPGIYFIEVEGGPPSATLLRRLQADPRFRPVAEAKNEKQNGYGRPVDGSVVKIGALEWESDSRALLRISTYKNPLDAFAEQLAVERRGSGPWSASVLGSVVS